MAGVRLSESLTWWMAPHPEWTPNPEWPEEVGFAAWAASDAYVLIDPLVRDDLDGAAWEPFDAAIAEAGRPVGVLLTAPWHERSARAVSARYDAPLWIETPRERPGHRLTRTGRSTERARGFRSGGRRGGSG